MTSRLGSRHAEASRSEPNEDDVYVLADDASAKAHLVEVLKVHESRRFVFSRVEG
jgi:hypothetical protein